MERIHQNQPPGKKQKIVDVTRQGVEDRSQGREQLPQGRDQPPQRRDVRSLWTPEQRKIDQQIARGMARFDEEAKGDLKSVPKVLEAEQAETKKINTNAERKQKQKKNAEVAARYFTEHHGIQIEATGRLDSVSKVLEAAKESAAEGALDYLDLYNVKIKAETYNNNSAGYVSDHKAETKKITTNADRKQKQRKDAEVAAHHITEHYGVPIKATGKLDSVHKVLEAAKKSAAEGVLNHLDSKNLKREAETYKNNSAGYVSDDAMEEEGLNDPENLFDPGKVDSNVVAPSSGYDQRSYGNASQNYFHDPDRFDPGEVDSNVVQPSFYDHPSSDNA